MDPKIILAAHRLIEKHGPEAKKQARRWAEECRKENDEEGAITWDLIASAVDEALSGDSSSIN